MKTLAIRMGLCAMCVVLFVGCASPQEKIVDAALTADAGKIIKLVKEGVSPDTRETQAGWPIVCLLVSHCHDSNYAETDACISYLAGKRANLMATNDSGFAALHIVPTMNQIPLEMIDCLVQHGANINQPANNAGAETPLHLAARQGRIAEVKRLIELGADPSIKNGSGQTALAVADRNGQTETTRFLRDTEEFRARKAAQEAKPATSAKS